jgi:cysteinyl-tRNA synthetase
MVRLPEKSGEVYRLIQDCDRILGLSLDREPEKQEEEELSPELIALVEARTQAKKARDFKLADSLRAELLEKGVRLEDTPQGVKWHRA